MRVPAEWESLKAIWIAWPHNVETWPGHFAKIPECFRHIVERISDSHCVNVIGDAKLRRAAGVDTIAQVNWIDIQTNDCWIRDYGPTYVVDVAGAKGASNPFAIDWRYNSWGGKYPPWDADDAATLQIARHAGWNCVRSELCVEGGALEWDGSGRLMTTSSCLLTDTRNPGWNDGNIREHFREMTGMREMVLVDGGCLEGDDTDGHIDQLARFIDRETVVAAVCEDVADVNYEGLKRNRELLSRWGQATSPNVTVHPLPIPPPRYVKSQRVPESYCNFLRLGPERVLVPTFGHPTTDDRAVGILKELVQQATPGAEVTGIDCRDLVWGLGALHCASLNEPATL